VDTSGADIYANHPMGIRPTLSNLLRNSALEVAAPPSRFSAVIESAVRRIHRWLKIDPEDPNTTYLGLPFRLTDAIWNAEDCAPNPIHFMLAVCAGIVLWVKFPRSNSRAAAVFAVGVFLAYLGFCVYLRWQPWHNRLHLPLLVLDCAFIGVALERHFNRRLIAIVFGLMSLAALAIVVNNYNHPLVGDWAINYWDRESRFFVTRPRMQAPYRIVVDAAQQNHCRQIGLIIGGDDWEYPLDMMMRTRLPDVRIEAYPDAGLPIWDAKRLHTSNTGWDENLRPYMVVKVDIEKATIVKFVP
jgi:hypothetical protein